MNFLSTLNQIPPTVLGSIAAVVLGSLLSLPALLLSLRHSRKLQAQQFAHDSAERTRERQMAWRREVYLEAAESISRLSWVLGSVADLNVSDKELANTYQADSAKISRIQIIASNKTVTSVNSYLVEFASLYMPLSLSRARIIAQRSEIESLTTTQQHGSEGLQRNTALLVQLHANVNADPKLRAAIEVEVEVQRKTIDYCQKRRLELMDLLPSAQNELLKESLQASYKLSPLITPALVAAREELGIPLDVEQYLRHSAEMSEQIKETTSSLTGQLDQTLAGVQSAGKRE